MDIERRCAGVDDVAAHLSAWFKDRPQWLQEATCLLLTKGRLTDKDIDALLDKCLREADSEGSTATASFPADTFHTHSASSVRLCTIGNVNGINALAPRTPLNFGPDSMAVVYGGNGSGKSGYVRILKHLCGARNPGALHPNVFAGDGAAQSADITYRNDDQECQVSWSISDGIHRDLRHVDIFDTECGRMYLEDENEVTYEPPALLFFTDLIAVCEQIARRIDGTLEMHASKKPQMPPEFTDTVASKWYSSMRAKTSSEETTANTKLDAEDERAISSLENGPTAARPVRVRRPHLFVGPGL